MKRLLLLIALILTNSMFLFAECDMFGMLSTQGTEIADIVSINGSINDPEDYIIDFFVDQMDENPDGYGIIYYKDNETILQQLAWDAEENQVFRQFGNFQGDDQVYDCAKDRILNDDNLNHQAVIAMGHARLATSNPLIKDPHPFVWDYQAQTDPDVPHYTFEHNGSFTSTKQATLESMLLELYPGWFSTLEYEYKTPTMEGSDGTVVDTEIYFHWIMANIKACNGNVLLGLQYATNAISGWEDCKMNFIFSDGDALYGYRNYGLADYQDYYLGYYDGTINSINDFRAIRTDWENPTELETINQHALAYIPRDGDIVIYPFFDTTPYGTEVSGIVSGNWDANNSPYIVSGNIIVNSTLTIEAGAEVFFADEYSFTING